MKNKVFPVRFFGALASVLLLVQVALADYTLPAGSTSQMVELFVQDTSVSTGAGLTGLSHTGAGVTPTCYYHRSNASSATSITLASSTLGTYTSGMFKEVSSANMPGVYQFGVPDAALAVGAAYVSILCKGATNMAPVALRIELNVQVGIYANGITGTSFQADGLIVDDSAGTTVGIASGGVDADDQFNNGFALVVFDSGGLISARSCITDSVNTGDTVVTAEDITARIAIGDAYMVQPDAGCSARLSTQAKSDVNAEVVDTLNTDTYSELSSIPSTSPTIRQMLHYVYQYFRLKRTDSSSQEILYKADGSTALSTHSVSDSGTVFTRGAGS